jgi:hypothetical protein
MTAHTSAKPRARRAPKWRRRGPWEIGATTLIGVGVIMLMQPFSLDLYTYSFVTILAGTLGFVLASHFPE